jgi:hypothetical protein
MATAGFKARALDSLSMAALAARRGPEVAGEDVVDLEAFGAGKPLAHVALEQSFPVHDGRALAV